MEKATLKQNIIREIVIAIFCICLAISNAALAAPARKINGGGKGHKEQKTTKKLTKNELSLLQKLEKEHQIDIADINVDEVISTTNYKKVLVYDMAGNLLQEQDATKTTIDLTLLPKGAKILMVDNDLAIYMVL